MLLVGLEEPANASASSGVPSPRAAVSVPAEWRLVRVQAHDRRIGVIAVEHQGGWCIAVYSVWLFFVGIGSPKAHGKPHSRLLRDTSHICTLLLLAIAVASPQLGRTIMPPPAARKPRAVLKTQPSPVVATSRCATHTLTTRAPAPEQQRSAFFSPCLDTGPIKRHTRNPPQGESASACFVGLSTLFRSFFFVLSSLLPVVSLPLSDAARTCSLPAPRQAPPQAPNRPCP